MRAHLIVIFLLACVMVPQRQHLRNEAARLRSHFDVVDRELRARDVSSLNPHQRDTRLALISWLSDYRDAGVFPQNNRVPDRATPFFRDDRGVLCAMAYLIARSGRSDIVNRVAATRNNAYIRELTDDSDLVKWLDDSGLTVSEAARIQPTYELCGTYFPCPPPAPSADHEYAFISRVTGAASLTAAVLSFAKPTKPRAWAAVIAGSIEVVAGATHFDVNQPTDRFAKANVIIGGAAVAAGVRALLKATRGRPADSARNGKTIDLALMSPFNALTQASQRGLQVRVVF